jgi:hypothetical protein
MADVRGAKDALARLACRDHATADRAGDAGSGPGDPDLVALAERAVDDFAAAARFRATYGLSTLGSAVEAAEGERAERGRAALSAFEAFEAAATPDGQADQHFRRGHGTDLRGDGKRVGNDAGDPHR